MSKTAENTFVSVGRRKTATARVRLTSGSGKITVNGKAPADYFKAEDFTRAALSPLTTVEMTDSVDIVIRAHGGGLNGQAGAVRLGIARALEKMRSAKIVCVDLVTYASICTGTCVTLEIGEVLRSGIFLL